MALLITITILIVVGVLLVVVVGVSVGQLTRTLPEYTANLQQQKAALEAQLADRGIDISGIGSLDALQPERLVKAVGGFWQV